MLFSLVLRLLPWISLLASRRFLAACDSRLPVLPLTRDLMWPMPYSLGQAGGVHSTPFEGESLSCTVPASLLAQPCCRPPCRHGALEPVDRLAASQPTSICLCLLQVIHTSSTLHLEALDQELGFFLCLDLLPRPFGLPSLCGPKAFSYLLGSASFLDSYGQRNLPDVFAASDDPVATFSIARSFRGIPSIPLPWSTYLDHLLAAELFYYYYLRNTCN